MTAEKIKQNPITKPKKQKVDKSKALNLRLTNKLSYSKIAELQGVSPQAIHSAIKHLLPTDAIKSYQENRADILSSYQIKLLQQLDEDRLKKMPAGSAVLAACQLYDKERLERGQSTANIAANHSISESLRESIDKIVGRCSEAKQPVDNTVDNYDKSQAIEIQGKEASD